MSGRQDGIRERNRWLSFLREGFVVREISGYVYEVNGKKVNIKFANPRPDNTFWFNTTAKRLREIDVFVWLCGTAENYYAIPCEKMRQLVDAGNWLDRLCNRPEFSLNVNCHEYLPVNLNISSYYRNLTSLR